MPTFVRRPSGRWQAKIRRKGDRPLSKTFSTKYAAEAWARKEESAQERGIWRDTSGAESTSLRECLDRYEREITPRKRSFEREVSHLRSLRALDIGSSSMARVRGADLAQIRDQWLRAGHSPATIVRRFALLSHVFETARREWGMEALANPCLAVRSPIVRNARERRLVDGEIEAILEACPSIEHEALIQFAIETGMRRSEICGLRWDDVNFRQQVAHLEITKNGESRDVPLSLKAIRALKRLPRRLDGQVFGLRPDSVTQAFGRALTSARKTYLKQCKSHGKRADSRFLVDIRFHDLRHEATTRLAGRLQLHELAAVTGHKDLRMLKRYYHPRAAELAKKLG